MSGAFSDDWLKARAVWDSAARNWDVEEAARLWDEAMREPGRPLRVIDLGAGNGNNQRHLAQLFPPPVDWLLVDQDAGLLEKALASAETAPEDSIRVEALDLTTADLDALLEGADLVTGSALFDLVSEEWLARFLDALAGSGAALLAVLTYDGRMQVELGGEDEDNIRVLFNAHQHSDKGFGPALGPTAVTRLEDALTEMEYEVFVGLSDWDLAAGEDGGRDLVMGWAMAAAEVAPLDREEILEWGEDLLADPDRRISVGHRDLFAFPTD